MHRPSLNCRRFSRRAFTLVEMMIAGAISVLVGGAAYTLLVASLDLYSTNLALNQSHYTGRTPLERMIGEMNNSGTSPILVNNAGADVPGSGPAAGVRYCTPNNLPASPVNSLPYKINANAAATSTTVVLTVGAGQDPPRDSDMLSVLAGPAVQTTGSGLLLEIASVAGALSAPSATAYDVTLTLRTALGTALTSATPAIILQQGAFIAVGTDLRYYNKVKSVARHGATQFNSPANFRVLARLDSSAAAALPFSYNPESMRLLRVDLRVRSQKSVERLNMFDTYFRIRSTVAVKSIYLDATKLRPIQ